MANKTTMKIPRLAVIISCWNYERYVAQAIRSVASQANEDCELIVVDDGSTDASWAVIQREGVRCYRTKNNGARSACLYGLSRTNAPFVLFLDADDELEPGAIDTIIENLDEGVAKLQFPLTRIDQSGNVISGPVPKLGAFRDRHLTESVLRTGVYTSPPTSGNVFRRDLCSLLEEVDYEQWVDGVMLFAAPFWGDVVSLSKPLGRYRIHDRNDSGLGRLPDATLLRKEISRFIARMAHLSKILARSGAGLKLVPAEQTYFYLERSFYLAIAEGRRASAADAIRLIWRLWAGYHPINSKVELTCFLLLTAVLPNRLARQSIAYRLDAGERSVRGFLQAVFASGPR
ncbi:glycosyltransferase involved in cell wall biosynthesis [Rhizobium mesoamericanum]|uniref:glycosyltransferase family 2 protein n=1 Tax=Rhizobium mesoamericanum TaxID=1079800 RepID=UPI0027803633|nr:glycosyltransferase family 2 protein [Rhizobium mesoamericanum]MDQ0562536.1 glycosyltransferase involved in cell wall biosynthesis [Rhizobium mesoamericanum]